MIGTLLAVSVPGFALGAVGMAIANRTVAHERSRRRWLKFAVYVVIVHAVLGAALLGAGALRLLYVAIVAACAAEFVRAWRTLAAPRSPLVAAGAALLAATALVGTWRNGVAVLAWCFVVVACGDGFAQVSGQLLGRRPLAPRISPTKTIEGAAGGLLAAALGSLALRSVVALPPGAAVLWGVALGAAGLAGDLGASWIKRRAGLKDYSQLLPGHGGFLDRFDSLIAALALIALAWPLHT